MPTTHIINWKQAANQRGLKYVIEPGTIYPGDSFTISLYDPQQYALISLYGGLSDKSIATDNAPLNELVAINAQPEFPLSKLTTVVSSLPIINADNRTVSESAGANLAGKVAVVDSQLSWDLGFEKVYGSASVDYETYPAQVWTHDGFSAPGQAVLFAQNLETLEYTDIPITVTARETTSAADNTNLEIVAVAAPSHFGWDGVYARLNVLPAALNPVVFTNVGRVERGGNVRHIVSGEKISLDGSGVIKTKFPPVILKSSIGLFYDAKDNPRSCNPFISGTGLSCESGVFGEITISYETMATQYDYFAETTGDLLTGFVEKIGPVMAVKGKKSVVFEMQPPSLSIAQKQEVLIVYFEKAINEQGEWELPPNIKGNPPSAAYPSTSVDPSSLMKTWNFVTAKVPVATVYSDGTFISTSENPYASGTSLKPFLGTQANRDRVYHIEKKIPPEFSSSHASEINTAEVELKKKWGIA